MRLQNPVPPTHVAKKVWYANIETPTVGDVYLQPWNRRHTQVTLSPGQCLTMFHTTRLENLVEGCATAGPWSNGILRETATIQGVTHRGAMRAGVNGHGRQKGVFLTTYFPGEAWCPPGSGCCICELEVVTATTVKSGSALRSCADDPSGAVSTKTRLTAIVVPFADVPPAVQLH